MSSGRRVTHPIDLVLMENIALRHGYRVEHNASVVGYWKGRATFENVPLVIHDKETHYDVGFTGQEILADAHGGYADHLITELMPDYQRQQFENNYVMVDSVEEMSDRIRLRIRR